MKAALLALLLAGCASGVNLTDEERIACRTEANGCSAWTEGELLRLVNRSLGAGYQRGWRDANVQAGRSL